ncbi:MAG: LacI family DNA-binding transcriptional regulator [Turicibacter sp.]|nr:LacI family DNA-binding transcriptional regulator [Turicibacter sp.]MEE1236883.1 LacI family DNA-binding transcriptional regulator [Turicibacter sp.]
MAKIKDIADLTGYSITTISRVLNQDKNFNVSDETRLKIMATAEKLNYVPLSKRNKTTKKNTSLTIGLVYWYSIAEEVTDPYYMSIRLAIENHCQSHNINLQKIYLPMKSLDEIASMNLDGLIALGKYSDEEIKNLYAINPHLVLVDCYSKHYNIDVVMADLKEATKDIITYLRDLELKKIGFICGIEQTLDGQELLDIRLTTYINQMTKLKSFNQNNVYLGAFTAESGYEIMSSIIKKDKLLDAYIVASDAMAIGCLKALNENNIKVPDVVSIISYDNISLSQFTIPSLTTIDMNTKHMGETALDLLIERVNNDREIAKKVTIPTRLIKRASSL